MHIPTNLLPLILTYL